MVERWKAWQDALCGAVFLWSRWCDKDRYTLATESLECVCPTCMGIHMDSPSYPHVVIKAKQLPLQAVYIAARFAEA